MKKPMLTWRSLRGTSCLFTKERMDWPGISLSVFHGLWWTDGVSEDVSHGFLKVYGPGTSVLHDQMAWSIVSLDLMVQRVVWMLIGVLSLI